MLQVTKVEMKGLQKLLLFCFTFLIVIVNVVADVEFSSPPSPDSIIAEPVDKFSVENVLQR